MAQEGNRRQSFYGDEEDIVVKPSTELIADEYEHSEKSARRIAVHTFASDHKDDLSDVRLFRKTLSQIGFADDETTKHCLIKENYDEVLNKVCNVSENLDGLILYFAGESKIDGELEAFNGLSRIHIEIHDIWNRFTTYNCPALKNKPKIFIFQIATPKTVETDGQRHLKTTYHLAYETPAEADILIVYNKNEGSNEFTKQLCENIKNFGRKEDIVSLATCVNLIESRPIIISTLTRKFFFTPSEARGLHLDIFENHEEMTNHIKEMKVSLSSVNPETKLRRRFWDSFNLGKITSPKKEKAEDIKSEPETLEDNSHVDAKIKKDVATRGSGRSSNFRPRTTSQASQADSESGKSSLRKKQDKDKAAKKIPWK